MKRFPIWLCVVLLLAGPGAGAAAPGDAADSPIIATFQGGRVSLAEFEDWVGFMDLMYPVPKTQYPDRAGWEREVRNLAKARAIALWRKAGIKQLQQPEAIEVDSARVEALQGKYVRKRWFLPLYEEEVGKWKREIRARYDEVKAERFADPPVYEFRHIFINTLPERGGRSESEAQKRMEQVGLALSGGQSFEEAAARYSDSKPSRRGALLGPVSARDLPEEFAAALADLSDGDTSRPFKTKNGYEFIHLVKKHPPVYLAFDEVKDELAKELPPPNYPVLVQEYLDKSSIPVDVFYPLEEKRREEYDEYTLLFRVGEMEYRLGDMYGYFDGHRGALEIAIPLNFNIEDLNFERFRGLAFFEPKSFNSWIGRRLRKEKILWVARTSGLLEEPEFKRYLTYLEEDTLARALSAFHTRQRMEEFDQEGNIQVDREALQPFIDEYLAAKGLSF